MSAEVNYFTEHIECTACHRKFCHTVREHDVDERYCMNCYMHRNGIEATLEIIRILDSHPYENNVMLWEIPAEQIPKEIYETIPFVKKGGPDK
jgi:hypothetical protein